MKLALIRRQYSATGGAELYMQRLLAALTAAGHETHLFAEKWQGQADGVQFHTINVDAPRAERPLRFAENLKEALQQEKFDCVFSLERTLKQDVYRAGDGLHRVWLERRKQFAPCWKRPFVGLGAFHRNMMALEARTFDPKNTKQIIVNSEMVRGEIARHFPSFPQERIHLVRNGVEVGRFQNADRQASRRRFGLKDDDFVLIFVGSGWERKGLPWLLQFMAARSDDPSLKLLVVTRDRMRGRIPPNVILTGPLSDVEAAYAAADVLTFLPIYEPCSNVVTEALAAGLPAITTSFNGASELIDSGVNGHVLDDPRDFATLGMCVNHWRSRRDAGPVKTREPLDLEANVRKTIQVLELAAGRCD
ncbi:glycosyltransferase family 4 protein [Prosthecobacter sp.]|jgi:UDP-glucose:(heptosyl)LPS alpha-1,3-glucosyltransferase|uniref:glycosyltransferase family 4 protein n=1 Tax=Prosthecobacter sp. TaxID=1965333 RepID=UPI0037847DFF